MPHVCIEGPRDVRLAEYRDVRDADLVRSRGLFVAEGRLVVQRLIQDGRYVLRSLLLNQAAFRALEATLARIPPHVPIYLCGRDDCSAITGFNMHRGCLALAERPLPVSCMTLLSTARLLVILEGVTDPDNVGGVFRSAAAFGADAVLLSPTTCDPLYRKAIRTSMATTLNVPFARAERWPDALADIRADRMSVVALTPREPSLTIDEFVATGLPDRVALLVGSEGEGLSAAALAQASCRVRIPTSARVDSLNLAVAAGIALSRLGRGAPR
jgi:tRNA G18 (ribose-2'-O)-methylase SpoU